MESRTCLTFAAAGIFSICATGAHAQTMTPEEVATLSGEDRTAKLEACAREEGEVTIYSSMIVDQALRPIIEGFSENYPEIEADFVRETGGQIVQRLIAETRAGQVEPSVIEATGIEDTLKRAGLAIPFTTPVAEVYADEQQGDYWVASRISYLGPSVNTDLVAEADLPQSFQDLTDPAWDGELVWSVESTGAPLFITAMRKYMGEEKAREFLTDLAENNVAGVAANQRQVVNQVMAGEYAMSLDAFLHHPVISAESGAPVAPLPLEPIIMINGSVMFPMNAPEPCAGMLLLDYILSEEGQSILREANYFPAHPDVQPVDGLKPILPENSGIEAVFLDPEFVSSEQNRSLEIYRELFR